MNRFADGVITDELLFGRSEPMQQLRSQIDGIAECNLPVLIEGESGTGKEVLARAIHARSSRHTRAARHRTRVCGATSESSSPRWPLARWRSASMPSPPATTRGCPAAGVRRSLVPRRGCQQGDSLSHGRLRLPSRQDGRARPVRGAAPPCARGRSSHGECP